MTLVVMSKARRRVRAAGRARVTAEELQATAVVREANSWIPAAEPAFVAGVLGLVGSGWLSTLRLWPWTPAVAVGACLINVYAAYVIRKGAAAGIKKFPFRLGATRSTRGDRVALGLAACCALLAVAAFIAR